jgi:eukaryotic-like serine/threonine-protein kinase
VSEGNPRDPSTSSDIASPASVERYLVFDEIGVGGMASVHLGMLTGAVGFRRIVALKQLHPRFIHDPDFVAQFINEARLAARIHHANVVQTLDVVWTGTQLLLVMEYVDGDTLNRVLRSAVERRQQVPIEVACSMVTGVLHGLHAAHEVRDEEGAPLDIVHRDVSPQNILIGRDGSARVLDFGVAKALAQSPNTQSGLLKGKFGYMAPEQIMRGHVDRRTDVFAAGVVLWETLTCRRLFQASRNIEQAMSRVVAADIPRPSTYRSEIPPELDAIVMKAMERDAEKRFQSAEELAIALERDVGIASPHLVTTWFGPLASPELAQRAELIRNINKRHGTPGRSTPHPNALADEARAAVASSVGGEESRRRSQLGEQAGGPASDETVAFRTSGPPSGGSPSNTSHSQTSHSQTSHSQTSHSQTMPSRMASGSARASVTPGAASAQGASQSERELNRSGKFALDALASLVKPSTRTLPPQSARLRHALALDEQIVPTTGGHISDVPRSDYSVHSRLHLWARNVGGALLALILIMATWVTAIGWNDQPPTSERLRARRAALLEAGRVQPGAVSAPNAPASAQTLDAIQPTSRRELSSRTEALRPDPPPLDARAAGARNKAVERQTPNAPPSDLELRLYR